MSPYRGRAGRVGGSRALIDGEVTLIAARATGQRSLTRRELGCPDRSLSPHRWRNRLRPTQGIGAPIRRSNKKLGAARCRLLGLVAAIGIVGLACSEKPDRASQLVAQIRNSDITWDGTYFGLMPRIDGRSSREVLAFGSASEPALLKALGDVERFAAAHVLLTHLNGGSVETSGAAWNGLRVELSADGSVTLDPEQRAELKAHWEKARKGGA